MSARDVAAFLEDAGQDSWLDYDVLHSLSNALEELTSLVHDQGAVLQDEVTLLVTDEAGEQHPIVIKWSEEHGGYVAKVVAV